ncbi:MAG: thiamine pyrophosphate-dependent dehydrogenase E1 component subunit alpha [Akkermansia sp.]|nr:thiamine pyrophosphate-dependent dehydrogenase E1 component subunit alpha [Akkermansia sp.]
MNGNEWKETALKAYRAMEMARAFDTKLSALYKAGKIYGGVFIGRGHEAIAACEGVYLRKGHDVYTPFIREQAGRCAWGDSVLESARCYFGSALGLMRGREGNVHWGNPREGTLAPVSHLGAMIPVVAGMLMAKRMQGEKDFAGVICIGDGTTSVGATHEGCNLIAVEKLPAVIVVTNNQYAYSTPNHQEFACKSLCDRGVGYGMTTHECDGTDFLQTLEVMGRAIAAARAGEGPQWVVANTLRMCGHGEHDDAAYIPQELKDRFADRDPLVVARRQVQEQGWLTADEIASIQAECADEVQRAVAQAQKEPTPNPATEDWSATSWKPTRH